MEREHLSRKSSPKSKGIHFDSDLTNETSDDSDLENYESDAEYLKDYIVIKESNEKGLGLMALKNLKKGIIIGIMRGLIIKSKKLLKKIMDLNGSNYIVQINEKRWINAIHLNCNVRFVNHSCDNNNCELVWLNDKIVGLRLLKNVSSGTFFNYNYRLEYVFQKEVLARTRNNKLNKFKCYCSENCPNFI